MKTQHKSMLTHLITLLFVIFQFVQFMPASLLSAITASAQSASPVTLFSNDKGSGDVKWTVSEDGKQITWNITVNQASSETEASPVAEIKLPSGVGAPKIESVTLNGNSIGTTFTTVNGNYRFNPQSYSTASQKLLIQFKTEVSDLNADTLAFGVGGSIELMDTQATPSLQNITFPNRLAQLEKERIAAEKEAARIAEEERLAAEKAEAEQRAEEERLEAERLAQEQADKEEAERLAQEEADKKAEEERLAAEKAEAEKEAVAELEEEEDKEDSIDLEEEQDVEEDNLNRVFSSFSVQQENQSFNIMSDSLPYDYNPDEGAIALNTELEGLSTNNHTRTLRMWLADGYIYVAITSTHDIEYIELDGNRTNPLHRYPDQDFITIDGTELNPRDGLQGNLGDAHFTIFRFDRDTVYNPTGTYSLYVRSAKGRGHDVRDNVSVVVPTVSADLTKKWVDGPMNGINVDLNTQFGTVDSVFLEPDEGTNTATYSWDELPYTDTEGVILIYTITESDPGEGYSVEFESEYNEETLHYTFTLTNTYTSPQEPITAVKTWINGPHDKPHVQFQLYRYLETETPNDRVEVGDPVTIPNPGGTGTYDIEVDMGSHPAFNLDGVPYIYMVEEITVLDYFESEAEFDENKDLWVITNTFESPEDNITAVKRWINGPEDKPDVEFQLYRRIGEGTPESVGEPVTIDNPGGTGTYDVEVGMGTHPVYNEDGLLYIYSVAEVDEVDNFITTYDETEGVFIVINTFESPEIPIEAIKTWVNGPHEKPHVEFQLYRQIGEESPEPVGESVTIDNPGGTGTYDVLVDMGTHDEFNSNGLPFMYFVREITELDHFNSVEDGLQVTNTYTSPLIKIAGTKSWENDTEAHRPGTLTISLFRMVEGDEELEFVTDVTTTSENEWTYTFGEQDLTDSDGLDYIYTITEEVPENYNEEYADDYYIDDVLQLDVSNTLVMGELHILKTDLQDNPITDNPAEFRLTRISPEGSEDNMTLETNNDGSLVFEDLLAGTYSLEETRSPVGFNLFPDELIIIVEKGEDGSTIVRYGESLINEEHPLVIRNRPSQQLPDTGSMGTTVFTLIGLVLMGGTVYGLKKNKKNTIKRSE